MKRWRFTSVFVLVLSAFYLYAFPSASIFYFGIVVLHSGVGVLFAAGLMLFLVRGIAQESWIARIGWIALAAGTVLGLLLIYLGTPHRLKNWLYAHIVLCTLGVLLLALAWLAERARLGHGFPRKILAFAALMVVTAGVCAGAWWLREV
ncbi:MAG: hypothetical protein WCE52_13405, partial [Candidatus Acidiferrum sp.]